MKLITSRVVFVSGIVTALLCIAADPPPINRAEDLSISVLKVVAIVLTVIGCTWKVSTLFNRIMFRLDESQKDRATLHQALRDLPCNGTRCEHEDERTTPPKNHRK